MKKTLIIFLVGAIAGAAGGIFGAPAIGDTLGFDEVTATVVAETRLEDKVQLQLQTEDEVLLATFSSRTDEVESLVSIGDEVVLRVRPDNPMLEDPVILHVRRGVAASSVGDAGVSDDAGEPDAGDGGFERGDAEPPALSELDFDPDGGVRLL